jgi:hypothetical protein
MSDNLYTVYHLRRVLVVLPDQHDPTYGWQWLWSSTPLELNVAAEMQAELAQTFPDDWIQITPQRELK